jgi:hypothetical protein
MAKHLKGEEKLRRATVTEEMPTRGVRNALR